MGKRGRTDYLFEKKNWENICKRVQARNRVALFLDFDGTLVPIQKDPSQCFLSSKQKDQLKSLVSSDRFRLSVLSGRSLLDIQKKVDIQGIYLGGNHGLDISGPDVRYTHAKAILARPVIHCIKRKLKKKIHGIEGAWLEDKKFALSLHYRSVEKKNIPSIKKIFSEVVDPCTKEDSWGVLKGKKVLELVPDKQWNKGKALIWIMKKMEGNCLPVYVGDDITDESAFERLGKKGITIRVGKSRNTSADYYLKGYWEMPRFLRQIQKFVGTL
jgi:trehalose 6-phosphate phosphatase